MERIRLIVKTAKKNGTVEEWIEDEAGEKVDISPRQCAKCGTGIWEGYVDVAEDENTYCDDCFEESFDKKTLKKMFKRGEQYHTQWNEYDFDRSIYDIIPTED